MTDIATNLSTIDGSLSDIKTAIVNKGVTPSGNITTYATAIGQISGGGGSGKYQLLERVKDDSNNEIGTVSGFFTDANDVEYAVVCLDADKRTTGAFVSVSGEVTNLPLYVTSDLYSTTETATYNTQTILDYCTANNYTSTACTRCRNNSFIIDGVTYYGQLPNIVELVDIYRNRVQINLKDTSGGNKIISASLTPLSSNQNGNTDAWILSGTGNIGGYYAISSSYDVVPVLEIPNNTPSGTKYYAWDTGTDDVYMTAEENPTTSSTVYILSDGIIYNISQQYNASISSVSGNTIDILASFLPEGGPVTATRDSSQDMTINYTPVIPN